MRGVPVRVEIGPRDIENDQVVLVRRDTGEKRQVARAQLKPVLRKLLADIQRGLFQRALDYRDQHTHQVHTLQQLGTQLETERGFAIAGYCGRDACEEQIREDTKATVRCVVKYDEVEQLGAARPVCPVCGEESDRAMYLARAY
jgi:prolyl-tRNA synthetase